MYYEAKGQQWRLLKKNIKGYGLSDKELAPKAGEPNKFKPAGKVKIIPPVEEDVSYDGKTLLRLENNKTLIKSGVTLGLNYPTIRSLDISLAPWKMAIKNAPLANQTITIQTRGSIWSISYADRLIGGRVSTEVAEFNAAKGFAPVRIYGTTNNTTTSETLFHSHRAGGNVYIVDSVLACSYPAAKHGKIDGEAYLIKSWSNKITQKDLKVKLPKKYLLIDEKYGEASPIFKIVGGRNSQKNR
jgi:hypothetical protein